MGKKINPIIFRINKVKTWTSRWFANGNDFRKFLKQDTQVKSYLRKKLRESFLAGIEIERSANEIKIYLFSARPGTIIGKGGAGIEDLKKDVKKRFFEEKDNINIIIKEVNQPNLNACLIAQSIAFDIERRIPFRRAIKQGLSKTDRAGAKGAKIIVSGRLNGAEIARTEKVVLGKLPLHTIRADIDYALEEAHTTYGVIGVKVWIFRGEKFDKSSKEIKR
ncbi:MAG TPA: 30S ribosomal protein S3 [Candidatus Bipolaricaulota bacterium]|nr:30S ribosomal protein S3 [Candidatus Bipolaricaulota bacterium]